MAVAYTIVELKNPIFEISEYVSKLKPMVETPIIDDRSFTFGSLKGSDNLYDNLADNSLVQTDSSVQSIKQIGNFDIDAAIQELHSNVGTNLKTGAKKDPNKSSHLCAKAVRMAMEAGGLSTLGRPNYGGLYGTYLTKTGWKPVTGKPQKGDIAVTKPHGSHSMGHISMYDGEKWISDFVQRDKFVYSSANDNNTTVYRYQG